MDTPTHRQNTHVYKAQNKQNFEKRDKCGLKVMPPDPLVLLFADIERNCLVCFVKIRNIDFLSARIMCVNFSKKTKYIFLSLCICTLAPGTWIDKIKKIIGREISPSDFRLIENPNSTIYYSWWWVLTPFVLIVFSLSYSLSSTHIPRENTNHS